MSSLPQPLVTSYDSSAEDRVLLRWSLWESQKKRCYICGDPFKFPQIEIDHVIPQSISKKRFDHLWENFGHGLPNDGVHSINNLRASCSECNSTAGKGKILFSPATLDLHLAKSSDISKRALRVQKRILRSGDAGKSAIVLTAARTEEEYELLWDLDVRQAILAAMYRASQILGEERHESFPMINSSYRVVLATTGRSARLLAAAQLATGLNAGSLASAVVERAIEVLDEQIATEAVALRMPISGANVGTSGWDNATFRVSIDSVSLEDDVMSYLCCVEVDENLSVQVSSQSADGSALNDSQFDFSVVGQLDVLVRVDAGDPVRLPPYLSEIEVTDNGVDVEF